MFSTSLLRSAASLSTPKSSIPVFTTINQVREWRRAASKAGQSVGFVPTMGALHQGHLDLVSQSLKTSPLTVLSIFVNPSQFSPTEDLATYPRTLPTDLDLLSNLLESQPKPSNSPSSPSKSSSELSPSPLVVFVPSVKEMYPNGITTVLKDQRGTFVEVKGFGDIMEGKIRPGFFRGVSTVVTKLFNIVQPDIAHFGQKDIQQALLLRNMLKDLHFTTPTPFNLFIHPTTRAAPPSSLALSSRNAYLSPSELASAPTLHRALSAARTLWASSNGATAKEMQEAAMRVIREERERTGGLVEGEYVEVFAPGSFLGPEEGVKIREGEEGEGWVVAGAMRCGGTRLIDNLLLGVELGNGKGEGRE